MYFGQNRWFSNANDGNGENKEGWSPVASDASEAASIASTKEFMKDAKEEGPIVTLKAMADW